MVDAEAASARLPLESKPEAAAAAAAEIVDWAIRQ
jgi:hypothetical protein